MAAAAAVLSSMVFSELNMAVALREKWRVPPIVGIRRLLGRLVIVARTQSCSQLSNQMSRV
jgi:hypothetical protein